MPDILELIALLVAGTAAGTINTLVGGGTYIMLPLLVFLGVPPQVANGTNRIAICFQGLAAARTLRGARIASWSEIIPPALAAFAGGVPGAYLASVMDPDAFRRWMGVILLAGVVLLFLKPRTRGESAPVTAAGRLPGLAGAFVLGVYGGFLGAGVGVMILLFLTPVLRLDLVRMLAVKVAMVFLLSLSAGVVFVVHGLVSWRIAVPLIIANVIGGVVGAKLAVKGGEVWLRRIVAVIAAVLAGLLIFGVSPLGSASG